MTEARPIVAVGIDGSEASKDALRWAAKQARLTGAEVHAVIAWQLPPSYGYYVDYSDADAAEYAHKTLEDVVAESFDGSPPVPVIFSVVKGRPAAVLIEASRSADLLVVGSRGRGAFTGMLLGSVSQHCIQHAACPVLVIRSSAEQPHQQKGGA